MHVRLILITVALLALAACGSGGRGGSGRPGGTTGTVETGPAASAAEPPQTGGSGAPQQATQVPASLRFSGRTLDGQPFDAASLAGRPVVLWFWAPWCATCAGQAGTVAQAAKTFSGRINVLGVAGLGDEAAMREFVKDTAVAGFPQLVDGRGSVWKQFEVVEQSTFVLLDRDGKVIHRGWLDHDQFTGRVAQLAA